MKSTKYILLALVLAVFLLPFQAAAADGDKVTMKLSAFKQLVTVVDGEKQVNYVTADQVNPGDILRYNIDFANTSNEDVYNFAIVDPIPAGVLFLDESGLKGARKLFSIDKGFSYHEPPLFIEVPGPAGTLVKKEAGPELYTHIKWQFTEAIRPGQKGMVSFTARVQ